MLKKILNFFKTNIKPDYITSTTIFPVLNLEKKKQVMKLAERGKSRGEKNEPSQELEILDEVEQQIIAYIETERKSVNEKLIDELSTYRSRITRLNINAVFQDILSKATNTQSAFSTLVTQGQNLNYTQKKAIVEAHKYLEAFKDEHNIKRPAQYPKSKFYQIAIICVLITVESLINMNFFKLGEELGLLAGFLDALIVSLVNIGVGLLFGWKVMPLKNHKNLLLKFLGYGGFIVYLVFVLVFNVVVAHYRIAMIGQSGTATKDAIFTFLNSPFKIEDLMSWILILLGIVFSFFAFSDGYSMDDPFPKYGALSRNKQELQDEYMEQIHLLYSEIDKIKDQTLKEISALLYQIDNRRTELRTIITYATQIINKYRKHIDYLEQCCRQLLSCYRDSNLQYRTEPAPRRFIENWHFNNEDNSANEIELEFFNKLLSESESEYSSMFSQVENERKKIFLEHEQALAVFQNLTVLLDT